MISVIIPNHNNASFLRESIESALSQDQVSEVLVIDDASSDGSVDLINKIAKKNHRITLLHTNKTQAQGAAYCRNLALNRASGKYISFLDSDDVYLDNRFKMAIKILESNESIDGVYDDVWSYDETLEKRNSTFDISMPHNIEASQLFEHLLFNGKTFVSIIGITLRSEVAKKYVMDTSLKIGEDSDYIWRLVQKHQLVHSGKEPSLIKRRVHKNNITKNTQLWDQSRIQLFDKWYKHGIKEGLPISIIGYFWRKKIHYQGKSKGIFNLPYKLMRYTFDIIKQPKLLTYLFRK